MIAPAVSVHRLAAPEDCVLAALEAARGLLRLLDPETRPAATLRVHDAYRSTLTAGDGVEVEIKSQTISFDLTVTRDNASWFFLRTPSIRARTAEVTTAICAEALRYAILVMETHLSGVTTRAAGIVSERLIGVAGHSLHAFSGAEAVATAPNHWSDGWGVVRHPVKDSDPIPEAAFRGVGHAVRIDAYRISAPSDDASAPPAVRIDAWSEGMDLDDDAVDVMRAVESHERRMAELDAAAVRR